MRLLLTAVGKMPIAALQCETIGQFVETVDYLDYGFIYHAIGETAQTFLPLRLIMLILHQFFRLCEGFQLCYP